MSSTGFVAGDIVRTEDPAFELVYKKLSATNTPVPGDVVIINGSDELIIADGSTNLERLGVMTSLVDRETGNVGVLERGYIVQESIVALEVDRRVRSSTSGKPEHADPSTDQGKIYGTVVGKANTNDQTTRVDTSGSDLVIIKVGDY